MEKILLFILIVSSLSLTSCSSIIDDDDVGSEFPKTVNIKLEVITTRNSTAIIKRTLNNDTQIDSTSNLPYSFSYTQQKVNQGTYLNLNYVENGNYAVGPGGSTWTDYDAELKITVENEVVQTDTFTIVDGGGAVQIDYTF